MMPAMTSIQCAIIGCPEDTTPQLKAHMGGNQVMGCVTSNITLGDGKRGALARMTVSVMSWGLWI
jgi:hypothetical protein